MTRLSWPGWLIKYREGANAIRTRERYHPSTNRARCRITMLIVTNALPLQQTNSVSLCGGHSDLLFVFVFCVSGACAFGCLFLLSVRGQLVAFKDSSLK